MIRKNKEETETTGKGLELVIGAIEKEYGKGSIIGHKAIEGVKFFSSQSIGLDRALGGGWARGRILEIYGPESSGKTTLTLHAIAQIQKEGGTAAFIDMEHAIDPKYASALGVNMETLILSQPDSGEQALGIVEMLVKSNAVQLIVIDSVAALIPRQEIEKKMGESSMGKQSMLMSQAMRKLAGPCSKAGCSVIFINQIRMKIGIMFGTPETTTGGNALKFYASQRVDVRRIKGLTEKEGTEFVGNRTRAKVVKNKVAPPFKITEFDIIYGIGIDIITDLLDISEQKGLIQKAGSWYSYQGNNIGQGKIQTAKYLKENPKVCKELRQELII